MGAISAGRQNKINRWFFEIGSVLLLSILFFASAPTVHAQFYGTVNPSDVGTKDCVGNGGKCLPPIGGVSVCQPGTIPSAGACPAGTICCKGTVTGTAGGSTEEAKGVCPSPPNPPGSSFTKPGIGSTPCGNKQCRTEGYLYFTDCLSESDCAANRGKTDGGNVAGCSEGQYCCRLEKNRCNGGPSGSKDPNKVYVCTSQIGCTSSGGKVIGEGFGCINKAYNNCCEFKDSIDSAMSNTGEPLQGLGGATGDTMNPLNRVARKYQNINSFCYTELECAKSSAPGAWVKGNGCPNKGNTPQGYCKAPPLQYDLQYPLGGVKTISDLKNFIGLIFNYAMSLIIIVAAVVFTYGGFRYMFAAISDDVQVGKTIMVDSVIGLMLGLGAFAIMANINFNTVDLRSFDVFMINKLSFYDNVYCAEVKPAAGKAETKFQEAGTPFAPAELDITKGYPLSLKDTQCGHEYFVEGGDSMSVCTGSSCGKGLCLNCTGGGKDCRSESEKEHICLDANIAGNLIMGGGAATIGVDWKNTEMAAILFCDKGSDQDYKDLASSSIREQTLTKGIVTGRAGSYGIKIDLDAVKNFKNSCLGKSGLLLEHHFDNGGIGGSVAGGLATIKSGLGGSWYYYMPKICTFNPSADFFSLRLFSGNLRTTSAFGKMTPENRKKLYDNSWSLDDLLASDKSPIRCDITYEVSSLTGAGSTGLGDNWHN